MEVVEILPLEYEPGAAGQVGRLAAQQDADRAARNEAGLRAWHEQTFGPVVGEQLVREALSGWRAAGERMRRAVRP